MAGLRLAAWRGAGSALPPPSLVDGDARSRNDPADRRTGTLTRKQHGRRAAAESVHGSADIR